MAAEDQEIRDLIAAGRKIEAIKLYRERFGVELKDAKAAVEALERGAPPAPTPPTPGTESAPEAIDPGFREELQALTAQGRKVEAVKLYRERTGAGLKEAKDAVDALDSGQSAGPAAGVTDAPMKSGCFVATAAYGSALAPEVAVLRRFRDGVLLRTGTGRRLVRFYYSVSPSAAAQIARSTTGRALARLLLRPIVRLCRHNLDGPQTR